MPNFLLRIFELYGLNTLQIILLCFFGGKIMLNHLKHIKDKIDELCERTKGIEKDCSCIRERVAKLEGKLE